MILELCTNYCIYDNFNLVICLKEVSTDEAVEQAAHLRSQMYILWGTLLYERSVGEFKMDLSTWEKNLAAALNVLYECFSGLGFKIDEIVQAWNEMYEAKRWLTGVPCFRL
uniref:Uncharacterized protein n=1 Tax=Lactuca sativa TaxID=4236 RepID=A0A9R1WF55_LACSA|nr:hypothetical protein LSAT_V11C200059880 [Lactuca sativa]